MCHTMKILQSQPHIKIIAAIIHSALDAIDLEHRWVDYLYMKYHKIRLRDDGSWPLTRRGDNNFAIMHLTCYEEWPYENDNIV